MATGVPEPQSIYAHNVYYVKLRIRLRKALKRAIGIIVGPRVVGRIRCRLVINLVVPLIRRHFPTLAMDKGLIF